MNKAVLELLYNPTFNEGVSRFMDIYSDAWDALPKDQQANTNPFALVEVRAKEKASLLTQMLVQLQEQTGAAPEEIKTAIQHYSCFLSAQSYFLNHIQELTETL